MQDPFPPLVKLALHKGANQSLQLVAIGSDGRLYVPAWQRSDSGQWIDPGVTRIVRTTLFAASLQLGQICNLLSTP